MHAQLSEQPSVGLRNGIYLNALQEGRLGAISVNLQERWSRRTPPELEQVRSSTLFLSKVSTWIAAVVELHPDSALGQKAPRTITVGDRYRKEG